MCLGTRGKASVTGAEKKRKNNKGSEIMGILGSMRQVLSCPHFTDRETEAESREVACSRSFSWWMQQKAFKLQDYLNLCFTLRIFGDDERGQFHYLSTDFCANTVLFCGGRA